MIDRNRKSIKVAIAETSLILRSGVAAALTKVADAQLQIMEIALYTNFENKVSTFAPDILIINPFFGGKTNIDRCKNNKDLGLGNTKFVALLSGFVDQQIIENYDATISIYDDNAKLSALISKLTNSANLDDNEEEQLSLREREIIREVVKGLTNKEIAQKFNKSIYTILTHRRNIARKLHIHSSTGLAIYAIANGLVSKDELKLKKRPSVDDFE
ncbi:MAG: response regulator transcription factor [Marinilabiliaceae bacterium]|jgi:DNA-binding CsgD family transcriptional regulator|nr:response regulator transcription factor [Bacteroidales bacterium]MCR5697629.1 response regulator transcription factor [Marinilabiliaceae bacterium]